MKSQDLDAIDGRALALLARDGRVAWADLAAELGLSPPAAAERVKRLVERGVVRGFEARIDARAIGYTMTAFVSVVLARGGSSERFLRRVRATAEVLECHHVTGDDDYLLKVRCRDAADLERIIAGVLKGSGDVERTRTTVALSTAKETMIPPLPETRGTRRKRR